MDLVWTLVENEQDYLEALEIRNLEYDFHPLTLEESRSRDAATPVGFPWLRFLGRDQDGRSQSRISLRHEKSTREGSFSFDFCFRSLPWTEPSVQSALEHVELRAIEMAAKHLTMGYRSTHGAATPAFARQGFVEVMRNPESMLDAQAFDIARFQKQIDRLRAEGIELLSVAEFAVRRPDDWIPLLWRLEMDVASDVPLAIPFQELSLNEYTKFVVEPHYDRGTRFVAVLDGRPIGISEWHASPANPSKAATYLTGVLRDHRRKGIATALKAVAINEAHRRGIVEISTDNEAENPMYQLNLQLGFKHAFDWLIMEKSL